MEKLKYSSTENYYEGKVVDISDGSVTIDIKGRLGRLELPKRMVINDNKLEVGHEVGFLMSFPEVVKE